MGKMKLKQQGISLSGTLESKNGQTLNVVGTIVNDQMNLVGKQNGVDKVVMEKLTVQSDKATVVGSYSSVRSSGNGSGLKSRFKMTRPIIFVPGVVMKPSGQGGSGNGGNNSTTTHSIDGTWRSALGDVKLTQVGGTVSGELTFSNGVVANLHGTLNDRNYNFSWGIAGQNLGTGSLVLQNNNRVLKGNYVDNRDGKPKNWRLTRK